MHRVHFRKEDVTIHVPSGTNLREACLESGIDPYPALGGMLSCRGKGFCGTCVVGVDEPGALSSPGKRESRYLKRLDSALASQLRLSCQAAVNGDVIITTSPNKREGWKQHGYYAGPRKPHWESAAPPSPPAQASPGEASDAAKKGDETATDPTGNPDVTAS